ncbi:hypothetical protein B0H17DRAFT_1202484 [Mycena rosella]|uniref:Uncharacterized protein n=1 Tax=Mycena rosella TaxID=1033263 RepID=A0AAD7GFV4_MYCRO|nr:hypothetical protein B0H17DRAFT_1202484 [Mycena rosella]
MAEIALQVVTATLSMRALSAAGRADATIYSGQWDSLQHMSQILSFVEDLLLVTNNAVTDSFLIYRCYIVWSTSRYKKKVVISPLLLLLSTTTVGSVTVYRNNLAPVESHFDSRILFGLAMSTNLLVTGLTVGRIWSTRRHLRTIGQTISIQRYDIAMSMLLESSVVYFIVISLLLVALSFKSSNGECPAAYVFYGFGGQLVNIIPALIIVRVSLARNTNMQSAPAERKLSCV